MTWFRNTNMVWGHVAGYRDTQHGMGTLTWYDVYPVQSTDHHHFHTPAQTQTQTHMIEEHQHHRKTGRPVNTVT